MELYRPDLNEQICNVIAADFVRLSQLKLSSNVIEKGLESKQAETHVDKIFRGTHPQDDKTLVCELGVQSKHQQTRITFLV